jgi:hypothetical protein
MSAITYDDVKGFCDLSIREGLRIDYKRDFPNELERIVASFSNTAGGIILIGVDTDASNRPSRIVGIPYVKGLEEKVLNICHSNTSPPITPEVVTCPYSSTGSGNPDKCIILVRVQESPEAPHFIGKKRNFIYVRIDNESEQADADSIQRLMEKREKGVQKSRKILESRRLSSLPIEITGNPEFPNWLTTQVMVIPSSITRDMIEFTGETDRILRELPHGHLQFGDENPKQNGVEWYFESDDSEYSAEVTSEGLISYREAITTDDRLNFPRVILLTYSTINFALGIYNKFGFAGKVIISLCLNGTKNRRLVAERSPILWTYVSSAGIVRVEKEIDLDKLALDPVSVVARVFLDFARAFKWSMSKEDAKAIVESWIKPS